ncbi:MAG: DUF4236 domain-containing protein [Anaerococcus sp.]|nr:DUF4236 domain-containing protein [Anaerococcus sp.]
MGVRFRKSINLGKGFRINLSKTGPGFSWGGKGFRLTRTAGGNIRTTASIPGTGLSYQKEFKNPLKSKKTQDTFKKAIKNPKAAKEVKTYKEDKVQRYDLDLTNIKSTGLIDILEELEGKKPYKLLGLIISLISVFLAMKNILFILGLLPGAFLYFYRKKEEVFIEYDFKEEADKEYALSKKLLEGILESDETYLLESLSIEEEGLYVVDKMTLKLSHDLPQGLRTNAKIVSLVGAGLSLSFLPDSLLIKKGSDLRALTYQDLDMDLSADIFIEDENYPKDAKEISKTYRHANKDGSKDKRYKDNPEVYLVEEGILSIKGQGLDIIIVFSDTYIDGI